MAWAALLKGATSIAKSSVSGGGNRPRPQKIAKEPIWSSGTTSSGEYLSSGDRIAAFRKSRRKISASSSALVPTKSDSLAPSIGGAIVRQSDSSSQDKIAQQLGEVSVILQDISNILSTDFANRIKQEKDEIADLKSSADSKKRGGKESSIEAVKKIGSSVGKAFDAVTAPVKGIFSRIFQFFGSLISGFIANHALKWLSNNQDKVQGFFNFLEKHGKTILTVLGFGIGGVLIMKTVKAVRKVIKFIGAVWKGVKTAARLARVFVKRTLPRLWKNAKNWLKGAMGAVKNVGKAIKGGVKGAVSGGKALLKGGKSLIKGGAKSLFKGLGKVGGKSLLKKIPIVGLGLGAVFAAGRLFEKPPDFLGAIMELGSGAASMIPGIGTGLSVALDAGSAVRDHKRSKAEEVESTVGEYSDVVDKVSKMDFKGNVRSSNIGPVDDEGTTTVLDTLDMSTVGADAASTGNVSGESSPMVESEDFSNTYTTYTKEQLGILD